MLQTGQKIRNRYEIQDTLGSGNFSTVYLAHDAGFPDGRRVAVKEFNPAAFPERDQKWAQDTIRQEARLLGNLPSHRGLANVLDYFEEGDRAYLVMEYVEGESLYALWQRQPEKRFPEQRVLDWTWQLCDVLDFLHNQPCPIIHGDLKPTNIIRRSLDGSLKLIDFGIARNFQPGQLRHTVRLGTRGYAAPETYVGQSTVRSDIYSLGVLLDQLLTGYDPTAPPQAERPVSTISPHVSQAIARATEKDPHQRYENVRQFAAALLSAGSAQSCLQRKFSATANCPGED